MRRAECEVAADAVWALMETGLVRKHRDTILAAAHAVGVTVHDLRNASLRWERGWRSKPRRDLPPLPDAVSGNGASPPEAPTVANGGQRGAPEQRVDRSRTSRPSDPEALPPQPTDRWCKACRQRLPGAYFYGSSPTCRRCVNRRRRELRVEKAKLLNAARLTFEVTDADALAPPLCCMDCGLALHVGEQVSGVASLRHVECPRDGLRRGGRPPRLVAETRPVMPAGGKA